MQKLKITTPGPDGHYHIVYVNEETGIGGTSIAADGHQHELIYDPPREPVEATPGVLTDPTTGEQMEAPDDPAAIEEAQSMGLEYTEGTPADPGKEVGTWIVRPSGAQNSESVPTTAQGSADLHDHEIIEYKNDVKKKRPNDKETIDECLSLWREALDLTSDCREKGRESEDFYGNKQWEDRVSRSLHSLDRAALTINEIAPNIDTLIGTQMEERTDWRFLPTEGGDQRVADMLNVIVKKITDQCYYPREETKVFKDICVVGFGAFNAYPTFNDNIQGDIKVERFPWSDIHYGPHEKEDLSDCEYEVRSRMNSIAKLKQMFGKKAEEIEQSYRSYTGQYPDVEKNDNGIAGEHTDYRYAKKVDDPPFTPYTVDGTFPLVDVQKKQFRLVQCTRKMYQEVTVIFNQEENFFFTAYDWKDEDIALASSLPGFQVISQLKTRMRITKFCGNVVLSDENPADLPLHDFYTVPCYAYRQNGEFWGKVEAAKDPQREINKRRSQVMDTMNRLGASVYYVEPETFKDATEKERFKKKRSSPGAIFDVNDIGRTPKLEEGAELPAAMVQIMQLDQENLQRLMNVMTQQGGANESNSLFLEKKKGQMTGNKFLFDNLAFAKQKLGKVIVSLVQRYYDAERCERLLNSQYSQAKFEVGGQDYSKYTKEEIIEMLENADLMEYDVIVSESSFAPSTRLGIAKVLFELISQGAAIPPEVALQFVDMPADIRANITQSLQAQTEAANATAQGTQNSEITKSLIGQGTYTVSPEKAQELGLVPVPQNNGLPSAEVPTNNEGMNAQDTEYADQLASQLTSGLAG